MTLPGTPFIDHGEEIGLTATQPDERIEWSGPALTPYPTLIREMIPTTKGM